MQRDDGAVAFDNVYASQRLKRMTKGITFETFIADELVLAAVQYHLIIIGEAVKNLSRTFKDAQPHIEWA
jgi:uncharacterized protein with HEPN domain